MSILTDFKAIFNPDPPEGYRIERNKLGHWRYYVIGSTGTREGCDFGEGKLTRRGAVMDAWSHRNLQCYEKLNSTWEPEKPKAGSTMKKRFVYRSTQIESCTTYEIGECDSPRKHESTWCDRRVCEGFWGDEARCKFTVEAMNKALN